MELYVLPISEAAVLDEGFCAAHFPNRLARSRNLANDADRLRCIGAGALIWHAMRINEAELIEGAHGKIDAAGGMHFNLSHSGDYVLLARHQSEVGADIERMDKMRPKLAARVLLPDEIEWMNRDPDARFFSLWTMKEGVLKLTGRGLSMSLQSFSVMPLLAGNGMALDGRTVYGAGMRIGNCAAAVCAYDRFDVSAPAFLTAREILLP